jgi:hypothetical protein
MCGLQKYRERRTIVTAREALRPLDSGAVTLAIRTVLADGRQDPRPILEKALGLRPRFFSWATRADLNGWPGSAGRGWGRNDPMARRLDGGDHQQQHWRDYDPIALAVLFLIGEDHEQDQRHFGLRSRHPRRSSPARG